MTIKVYITSPLTGIESSELEEITAFYEAIALLCKGMGLKPYVPHQHTDPTSYPNITPRQVYEMAIQEVSTSGLAVAYVGYPSLGVGMELAYAQTNGIPIILLYERGRHISRLLRGIPTVVSEIQFSDYKDALAQLMSVLEQQSTATA